MALQKTLLDVWRRLNLSKSAQMHVLRVVNDEFLVGMTGVIFNKNDEVLIVKHTYRRVPWSLPGGFLKGKEHPKKGAEVIDYGFFSREKLPRLIKNQYKQIDLAYERYGKLHQKPLFGKLSSLWSCIRRNKSK